jgi:hypothetical protein
VAELKKLLKCVVCGSHFTDLSGFKRHRCHIVKNGKIIRFFGKIGYITI